MLRIKAISRAMRSNNYIKSFELNLKVHNFLIVDKKHNQIVEVHPLSKVTRCWQTSFQLVDFDKFLQIGKGLFSIRN